MKNRTCNFWKAFVTVILSLSSPIIPAFGQQSSLGLFEGQTDVGQVLNSGSATYDAEKQEYTIAGSGTNMWFDRDEFHFVWTRMKGNFILRTRAHFLGKGADPHRKLGWIVRSSLDTNATHINAALHGDSLVALQFRRTVGGPTEEVRSSRKGTEVIQLERKGNTYIMSVADFGDTLMSEQVADLALGDQVYVGLFVCSHNKDVIEKAVFRDVRIVVPPKDDYVPYRDYIGSNVEILDIESGNRKIILRSPESLQAPNWTPDGKALIYNHNGKLYRFDLATNEPEVINTDFATSNNNDHVLTFDGKMLGISHHSKDDENKSIIYTLPVQGGKPKRITAKGPSYLHGWSPDGKFLIYTAERNGDYDIYKYPQKAAKKNDSPMPKV
jgi:hypothetical protein